MQVGGLQPPKLISHVAGGACVFLTRSERGGAEPPALL